LIVPTHCPQRVVSNLGLVVSALAVYHLSFGINKNGMSERPALLRPGGFAGARRGQRPNQMTDEPETDNPKWILSATTRGPA